MKFFYRSRDADIVRNYQYNDNMEIAKLGRKQSCKSVCAMTPDSVFQPHTRRASERTVRFMSDAKSPDHKLKADGVPSILDSYRNRPNLWPKTLFEWATSPIHCSNLLKILHRGDGVFLVQILMALRSLRSDRVVELTIHVIGCRLLQKLLEVGSEAQCLTVLKVITRKHLQLITIACSSSGKGVVQKMIEMFKSLPKHMAVMLNSLEHDTLRLAIDRQGQSVIYCCLRYLSSVDCRFIFEILVRHFMDIIRGNISYDGFGGVILVQHCLKVAPETYQQLLVEQIADHAFPLCKDPVGHYLVLDLLNNSKWIEVSRKLVRKLKGNFSDLAMQNISSKVVQECLNLSSSIDIGMSMECIVRELIESPIFPQMPLNVHAQSVIQSACALSKGNLREDLNVAIANALEETEFPFQIQTLNSTIS